MTRLERCIVALHDLGSREGATMASVKKALRDEGFTNGEIAEACEEMLLGKLAKEGK